jgi:hypothetical protein
MFEIMSIVILPEDYTDADTSARTYADKNLNAVESTPISSESDDNDPWFSLREIWALWTKGNIRDFKTSKTGDDYKYFIKRACLVILFRHGRGMCKEVWQI